MGKINIWVGNFDSKEAFEEYFSQESYLKAWSIYDNEPPTGKEGDDQEPDPELRCQFCKEIGIDNYDEDFIVLKYYHKLQKINMIVNDVPGDTSEFLKSCKEHEIEYINVLVAYENHDLTQKDASQAQRMIYLGEIAGLSDTDDKVGLRAHHLWLGKDELPSKILNALDGGEELSKVKIAEILGINKEVIEEFNYYYTENKEKVDEIIVTHIEDYNIAEKMILKADELGVNSTTKLMLEVISDQYFKIDKNEYDLIYIGSFFESE